MVKLVSHSKTSLVFTLQFSGAPNNGFLSNDLKCCHRLSRLHLKLSRSLLCYLFGHSKGGY